MTVDIAKLRALCDAAIEFAPGYYVDHYGCVFSVESNWRGYGYRALTHTSNSHGYASVRVMLNGRRKRFLIHALVARYFLPQKPSSNHQIRHLDGNRMNPCDSNLAWGTAKENADDRDRHGTTARGISNGSHTKPEMRPIGDRNGMRLHPERNGNAKLFGSLEEIKQRLARGESQSSIARSLGVHPSSVNRLANGGSWRTT